MSKYYYRVYNSKGDLINYLYETNKRIEKTEDDNQYIFLYSKKSNNTSEKIYDLKGNIISDKNVNKPTKKYYYRVYDLNGNLVDFLYESDTKVEENTGDNKYLYLYETE